MKVSHRPGMSLLLLFLSLAIASCSDDEPGSRPPPVGPAVPVTALDWTQWGKNPRHSGQVGVVGQNVSRILADIVYDPHAAAKKAEFFGALVTHYQVPLVVGDQEVLMAFQSGRYVSCSPPGSGTPFPCASDGSPAGVSRTGRRRTAWSPSPSARSTATTGGSPEGGRRRTPTTSWCGVAPS